VVHYFPIGECPPVPTPAPAPTLAPVATSVGEFVAAPVEVTDKMVQIIEASPNDRVRKMLRGRKRRRKPTPAVKDLIASLHNTETPRSPMPFMDGTLYKNTGISMDWANEKRVLEAILDGHFRVYEHTKADGTPSFVFRYSPDADEWKPKPRALTKPAVQLPDVHLWPKSTRWKQRVRQLLDLLSDGKARSEDELDETIGWHPGDFPRILRAMTGGLWRMEQEDKERLFEIGRSSTGVKTIRLTDFGRSTLEGAYRDVRVDEEASEGPYKAPAEKLARAIEASKADLPDSALFFALTAEKNRSTGTPRRAAALNNIVYVGSWWAVEAIRQRARALGAHRLLVDAVVREAAAYREPHPALIPGLDERGPDWTAPEYDYKAKATFPPPADHWAAPAAQEYVLSQLGGSPKVTEWRFAESDWFPAGLLKRNEDEDRVQIYFDEQPSREARPDPFELALRAEPGQRMATAAHGRRDERRRAVALRPPGAGRAITTGREDRMSARDTTDETAALWSRPGGRVGKCPPVPGRAS
jgi:hypothetical protein